MSYIPDKALIVQSDRTILLEVHSPKAEAARKAIACPHEKLPDLEEDEFLRFP